MTNCVRREPVAWALLASLVGIKLAVHLVAVGQSWGYMTDELYYLDSVDHLDWGYVDHPPLSVFVLRLVRDAFGTSQLAVRIVPMLLGGATVALYGLIAREMGGGRRAQGIAALAALCAPVYLVMQSWYSMNAIEQFLWPLCMFVLLRIVNGASPRLWLVLGVTIAAGMANKVSMIWFGAGLGAGLVLTPERRWLRTPWPWAAAGIAVLGVVPFVLWQIGNGWPFLEFSRNASIYKVGEVTVLGFLGDQILAMNALAAPLWIGGLVYAFTGPTLRPYRCVAWIFVVVVVLLVASGGARPHYAAPAYAAIFAAASVGLERLSQRRPWLIALVAGLLVAGASASAPLSLPLMSPRATIAYQEALGLRPREELERGGLLPMHLALFFHTEAILEPVREVYESLPPGDRARVEILTGSFGETGAINVLGRELGLPRSLGTHNQYWLWGPGSATGELMIVVHESESQLREWFTDCERRREIDCPYCMEPMRAKAVFLCREPRRPLPQLWPEMKLYR